MSLVLITDSGIFSGVISPSKYTLSEDDFLIYCKSRVFLKNFVAPKLFAITPRKSRMWSLVMGSDLRRILTCFCPQLSELRDPLT